MLCGCQGMTLAFLSEGFNPDPWSDLCAQTEPFTSTKKDKPLGMWRILWETHFSLFLITQQVMENQYD
jgi:hypothetical protein